MNDHNKTKEQLIAELQVLRNTFKQENTKSDKPFLNIRFLKDLIANNPISVQILDKEGHHLEGNPAYEHLFRATPPPHWTIFTDPQLLEQNFDEAFELLKSGKNIELKNSWYNAHLVDEKFPDDLKWIYGTGFCIFDEKDEIEYFVIMHKDIGDRKKLFEAIEEKNRYLKNRNREMDEAREKERAEISDEIHDELAQVLTVVKLELELLGEKITKPSLTLQLDKVSKQLDETLLSVHRILSSLYDERLEEFGIQLAIESYCRNYQNKTGIRIKTDIEHGLHLPSGLSLVLYKIMKAAMTNILNHARASDVEVVLKTSGDTLYFSIADNGCGMTAHQINSPLSMGIISMKNRINKLYGQFEIISEIDRGTQIKICIPL